VDTLANLSPSQVEKKVKKIRDISGQSILDLSKSSDRLGLLEKTLVDTLNSVSTPYSRTWKVKVTPQGHLVFQLRASVQNTKEKESGLWRTPDNMAGGSNLPGIQKALDAGHLKRPSGQQIQIRLADQVREKRLWPTPLNSDWKNMDTAKQQSLSKEAKLWPTPTSRDGKGGYIGGRIRNGKISRDTLDVTVQHTDNKNKTGGTLNPNWVEWLMGYPIGWTDLKD
jgi:hypothetical protein